MWTAWVLGSSEMQLGQAVGALKDLSARGVDSCRPVHVEAMRQAALRTGPVRNFKICKVDTDTKRIEVTLA